MREMEHMQVIKTAAILTQDVLMLSPENGVLSQFLPSDQVRESGKVPESEYAVAEGKLRNLWNQVG